MFLHVILCVRVYGDALRRGRTYEYANGALAVTLFLPLLGTAVCMAVRNQ